MVTGRLKHRRHFIWRKIALAFDNLVAASIENNRRWPAVLFVAVREIRTRVLIEFDSNVMRLQQLDDLRIAVGVGVHYVAPVAPHGLEIEQDETVVALGFSDRIGPRAPVELALAMRGVWRCSLRGGRTDRKQQNDCSKK